MKKLLPLKSNEAMSFLYDTEELLEQVLPEGCDLNEEQLDTLVQFIKTRCVEYSAVKSKLDSVHKWHKQSHRPPVDEKNAKGYSFSHSVLLYSPSLDVFSIGWFDFDNDAWSHIADEEMEDFIWTGLKKPETKKIKSK